MTYNDANRLVTYNGQKVRYDEKGNMTYGPVDGKMQELSYDCRNRLVEAGGVSYTYDAENTRIATTEDGLTTEYVTDTGGSLSRLLVAYEADNTETTYYYGAEGLAAQYNSGTGKYYAYHYDNIGSTTLITAKDGHAVERFSYGTYGELLKAPITKIRFLYNGSYGVTTDSNGLYYMRARYYNPDIKRFINQDIKVGDIGSSQSLNRYAYCEGNPVSMVDPFGLCGEDANDQGQKSKYQWLHNALDWAGLVFDGADIVNGILYAAEGDYVNAAISFACGIPAVGTVIAGVAKMSKAAKAMKTADRIADLCKADGKVGNTAAGMKANYDTYMQARREGKSVGEAMTYTAGAMVAGLAMGKAANWGANKLKNLANKALPKLKTAVQEGAGKLASKISKGLSSSGSGRMSRNRGFVVNPFYKGGSKTTLALPSPQGTNPWMKGTKIISMPAPKDCYINMAMAPGQKNPGGWGTFDNIPDVDYVRNNLAVTPEFKPEVSEVQRFLIPEGIQIQVGVVGPQKYNNIVYPGGGNQVQILNFEDRASLIPVGPKNKIY